MDKNTGTDVKAQVGSCVLLNPHARPAPHIHSWQIGSLPNVSRQLSLHSKGTIMPSVNSTMKATLRTLVPCTANRAFKVYLTTTTRCPICVINQRPIWDFSSKTCILPRLLSPFCLEHPSFTFLPAEILPNPSAMSVKNLPQSSNLSQLPPNLQSTYHNVSYIAWWPYPRSLSPLDCKPLGSSCLMYRLCTQ